MFGAAPRGSALIAASIARVTTLPVVSWSADVRCESPKDAMVTPAGRNCAGLLAYCSHGGLSGIGV